MYCSFRTSCSPSQLISLQDKAAVGPTDQNSNHRVVIWIVHVVGEGLNELEEICDEAVVHEHEVLGAQALDLAGGHQQTPWIDFFVGQELGESAAHGGQDLALLGAVRNPFCLQSRSECHARGLVRRRRRNIGP